LQKTPIRKRLLKNEEVSIPSFFCAQIGFLLLITVGFINKMLVAPKVALERNRKGFANLYEAFDEFFLRYIFRRGRDCFNHIICSVPGATVVVKDRVTNDFGWTFELTGTTTECINMTSYNYLGFAQNDSPCTEKAIEATEKFGIATNSPRKELGKDANQF